MALSTKDHQRNFAQRRKQEKEMGLKRAVFMLTQETTTRIDALAGFYELKPEEVITRAIQTMWQDRLVVSPTFIAQPRTVKVADDPEPTPGQTIEPVAEPSPEPVATKPLLIRDNRKIRNPRKKMTYSYPHIVKAEKEISPSANPDQAENGSASKGIG